MMQHLKRLTLFLTLLFPAIVFAQTLTPPGNALDFDGSDDYTETNPMIPYNDSYTVTAWIKPVSNTGTIICWGSETVNNYTNLKVFYGKIKLAIGNGTDIANFTGTTDIGDGLWHHVALVKESEQIIVYIDGDAEFEETAPTTISPTSFTVGCGFLNGIYQGFINSAVDELVVWDYSQTQCEILSTMNCELFGDETNLLAYYNFNQGDAGGDNRTETTLTDATDTYNATLIGYTTTNDGESLFNGSTSNWIVSGANLSGYTPIEDNTAPIPDVPVLPDITAECEVDELPVPTATDDCVGSVSGTLNISLPITNQGTTVVTWTYDDGNGNTSNQTQNIVIEDITNPTITCTTDQIIDLEESQTVYIVQGTEFDATAGDNCSPVIIENDYNSLATLEGEEFTAGIYTITWSAADVGNNIVECDFALTVNDFVDVKKLDHSNLSIYPNPSKGIFTIETDKTYDVVISDISGKVVYASEIQANSKPEIDLSNQSSGIYLVTFKNAQQTINTKLVIE
ncbi:MAG: LamG-like jellyroll fold domain-containing protein [Bacteroidota bacterium]|nr:LamG-like jellyroll fold domain-containing protein [Bacteroidota bacterium]